MCARFLVASSPIINRESNPLYQSLEKISANEKMRRKKIISFYGMFFFFNF